MDFATFVEGIRKAMDRKCASSGLAHVYAVHLYDVYYALRAMRKVKSIDEFMSWVIANVDALQDHNILIFSSSELAGKPGESRLKARNRKFKLTAREDFYKDYMQMSNHLMKTDKFGGKVYKNIPMLSIKVNRVIEQ